MLAGIRLPGSRRSRRNSSHGLLLVTKVNPLGIRPEFFQRVVVTDVRSEDVRNHVAEVHEDPLGRRSTLDVQWTRVVAGDDGVDVVRDGFDLPVGVPRADDEVVGDGGQLRDVEDDDVGGFLLERCPGDCADLFFTLAYDRCPP